MWVCSGGMDSKSSSRASYNADLCQELFAVLLAVILPYTAELFCSYAAAHRAGCPAWAGGSCKQLL